MNDRIYYKPLTPELRERINYSIDQNIAELNDCSNTYYVRSYLNGYKILKNLINNLPDGYPMPFTRRCGE